MELKHLIDVGNEVAADRLAEVAAGRGDADTLNCLIDAGNELAAGARRWLPHTAMLTRSTASPTKAVR